MFLVLPYIFNMFLIVIIVSDVLFSWFIEDMWQKEEVEWKQKEAVSLTHSHLSSIIKAK